MRAETRHQLKQDAFSRVTIGAAEKTAHWSVEHRSTLAVGVVALLLIAGAVAGGWYYLSAQDEKASFDLSQAVRTLETPLRPAGSAPGALRRHGGTELVGQGHRHDATLLGDGERWGGGE